MAAIEHTGEHRREGITGKVGDEAALFVNQLHQGLENIVEDQRKLLGPYRTLLHEGFRQGSEARKVDVHRKAGQLPGEVVGEQALLDEGGNKGLQEKREWVTAKDTSCGSSTVLG